MNEMCRAELNAANVYYTITQRRIRTLTERLANKGQQKHQK